MNNQLQVFSYEGAEVRTVMIDGEVWFVGKDVASVLGYKDTRSAILDHVDEEDRRKWRITTPANGGYTEMTVINESGLYSLILSSKLPTAKKFKHWVTSEVLPQIHSTGSYSVAMSKEDRELKREELSLRKRELDLNTAKLLKEVLDAPPFPLTDETRTVFGHALFQLATGQNYLSMLPECTEKWYTATELGEIFGISKNKVGRIAKANGLKAPEGESNEYGRWIFSKSQHSSREVPSFIYSEAAVDWFRDYQDGVLLGR